MKEQFLAEVMPHQAVIHKICQIYRENREDREDLFQEIIYQLWKAYPQYQRKSKISTWMYRIGLNTAIATFRKAKIEWPQNDRGPKYNEMSATATDERLQQLYWAIRQLNEADKALIALYLDDLNYREMAKIMGISENNVGVRLNRAKNKIKNLLQRQQAASKTASSREMGNNKRML